LSRSQLLLKGWLIAYVLIDFILRVFEIDVKCLPKDFDGLDLISLP